MATITEMKRENSRFKGMIRGRFRSVMNELDKKIPDLGYIKEKTRKMNTDAYLIIHNKKLILKTKLRGVV